MCRSRGATGDCCSAGWPEVVQASSSVDDYERSSVMAFLSGKQNPSGDYSSQSGEIVGILKVRTACVFGCGHSL